MESIAKKINVHPDDLKHYLIQAGVLGMGLALCGLILTMFNPYTGEIVTGYMIRVGWWVNIVLVAQGCICLIALAVWNFGKGVKIETINTGMLLSSGNWQEPDISPDVLLCNRPGESKEQFAARVQDAKSAATDVCIAVVIPFRLPRGFMYNDGVGKDFAREEPPFQSDEWPEEHRFDAIPQYYVYETQQQYREYLDRFAYFWREYSPKIKVGKQDTVAARNMAFQKMILTGLALLFFCIGLFSQSAAQVEKATSGMTVPEKHADVSYQFEKKTFGRVGNGRSNYADLLRNIPAYRDCCHGSLIAVYKDGELIAKGASVEQVAASSDPIRPRGSVVQPETVEGFEIPDSNETARMIQSIREQSRSASDKTFQVVRPWWSVFVEVYWDWFWLICIITAAPYAIAKLSGDEGFWDLYRPAKRMVLLMTSFSAILLLINVLLLAKENGVPNSVLGFVAVALAVLTPKVLDRMNPDYRPKFGNDRRQDVIKARNDYPQITP